MTKFRNLVALAFAATMAFTAQAETGCPGNVASLPFHIVNRYQILVPVSINHEGPYTFLVDTGSQMTMLDSSLAKELHLNMLGTAQVLGTGFVDAAKFAEVERIEAGPSAVAGQRVLVYDLHKFRGVRGVLGVDFLEHFDMLIDYAHEVLCLDETGQMRGSVKGQHVPLVAGGSVADHPGVGHSMIVSVRMKDGMRPVRMKLDSGASGGYLYNPADYMDTGLRHNPPVIGFGVDGKPRYFSSVPAQTVKIGSVELDQVAFISVAGANQGGRTSDFDGLLPTGLFRWVFVSQREQVAVFGR
jgi:hypothetical protein